LKALLNFSTKLFLGKFLERGLAAGNDDKVAGDQYLRVRF